MPFWREPEQNQKILFTALLQRCEALDCRETGEFVFRLRDLAGEGIGRGGLELWRASEAALACFQPVVPDLGETKLEMG